MILLNLCIQFIITLTDFFIFLPAFCRQDITLCNINTMQNLYSCIFDYLRFNLINLNASMSETIEYCKPSGLKILIKIIYIKTKNIFTLNKNILFINYNIIVKIIKTTIILVQSQM